MSRLKTAGRIDAATKRWTLNTADEKAVANGCRFEEKRAQFVIDWIQKYCRLYEGDCAGQPLELRDWQLEITMRLFGWVKFSDEWGRKVRRFRKASIWVPKKNKKSPTLAAWGLYLLCGDGEMGQKVYSVAKDGKQALISHTHAIEMVRRSPELEAECSINNTTFQITHEPSRSFCRIVAGDNPQSQEGLNGSLMVDETHVVDRKLMKILRGAGISRSEPLQIEVSTAGNNPDGYGKERFDYGRKVESGDFEDEQLLFAAYAAPQQITDAELDADPVKWGKLANPAWGHTIKETEFLADYQAAKRSLTDLLDFKMYRLNVWQQSANPWLKMGDWQKNRRDYSESDLIGRRCYAGLDLAKTCDTTSLVLVFPEADGSYKQLAYFWLPENTAATMNHLVQYQSWAAQGFITLTPGDVCDYNFVRHRINEIRKQFDFQDIAFDGTYAEQLMQRLVEEDGLALSNLAKFPQTIMAFAKPTADYERLLIDGKLHHNGNPVLTWQAGNVTVRTDPNQNLRPMKEKKGDHRKIDGIVAAIMALGRAIAMADAGSVYETRGLLMI